MTTSNREFQEKVAQSTKNIDCNDKKHTCEEDFFPSLSALQIDETVDFVGGIRILTNDSERHAVELFSKKSRVTGDLFKTFAQKQLYITARLRRCSALLKLKKRSDFILEFEHISGLALMIENSSLLEDSTRDKIHSDLKYQKCMNNLMMYFNICREITMFLVVNFLGDFGPTIVSSEKKDFTEKVTKGVTKVSQSTESMERYFVRKIMMFTNGAFKSYMDLYFFYLKYSPNLSELVSKTTQTDIVKESDEHDNEKNCSFTNVGSFFRLITILLETKTPIIQSIDDNNNILFSGVKSPEKLNCDYQFAEVLHGCYWAINNLVCYTMKVFTNLVSTYWNSQSNKSDESYLNLMEMIKHVENLVTMSGLSKIDRQMCTEDGQYSLYSLATQEFSMFKQIINTSLIYIDIETAFCEMIILKEIHEENIRMVSSSFLITKDKPIDLMMSSLGVVSIEWDRNKSFRENDIIGRSRFESEVDCCRTFIPKYQWYVLLASFTEKEHQRGAHTLVDDVEKIETTEFQNKRYEMLITLTNNILDAWQISEVPVWSLMEKRKEYFELGLKTIERTMKIMDAFIEENQNSPSVFLFYFNPVCFHSVYAHLVSLKIKLEEPMKNNGFSGSEESEDQQIDGKKEQQQKEQQQKEQQQKEQQQIGLPYYLLDWTETIVAKGTNKARYFVTRNGLCLLKSLRGKFKNLINNLKVTNFVYRQEVSTRMFSSGSETIQLTPTHLTTEEILEELGEEDIFSFTKYFQEDMYDCFDPLSVDIRRRALMEIQATREKISVLQLQVTQIIEKILEISFHSENVAMRSRRTIRADYPTVGTLNETLHECCEVQKLVSFPVGTFLGSKKFSCSRIVRSYIELHILTTSFDLNNSGPNESETKVRKSLNQIRTYMGNNQEYLTIYNVQYYEAFLWQLEFDAKIKKLYTVNPDLQHFYHKIGQAYREALVETERDLKNISQKKQKTPSTKVTMKTNATTATTMTTTTTTLFHDLDIHDKKVIRWLIHKTIIKIRESIHDNGRMYKLGKQPEVSEAIRDLLSQCWMTISAVTDVKQQLEDLSKSFVDTKKKSVLSNRDETNSKYARRRICYESLFGSPLLLICHETTSSSSNGTNTDMDFDYLDDQAYFHCLENSNGSTWMSEKRIVPAQFFIENLNKMEKSLQTSKICTTLLENFLSLLVVNNGKFEESMNELLKGYNLTSLLDEDLQSFEKYGLRWETHPCHPDNSCPSVSSFKTSILDFRKNLNPCSSSSTADNDKEYERCSKKKNNAKNRGSKKTRMKKHKSTLEKMDEHGKEDNGQSLQQNVSEEENLEENEEEEEVMENEQLGQHPGQQQSGPHMKEHEEAEDHKDVGKDEENHEEKEEEEAKENDQLGKDQPGLQQPGLQQPGLQQSGLQQPGQQQCMKEREETEELHGNVSNNEIVDLEQIKESDQPPRKSLDAQDEFQVVDTDTVRDGIQDETFLPQESIKNINKTWTLASKNKPGKLKKNKWKRKNYKTCCFGNSQKNKDTDVGFQSEIFPSCKGPSNLSQQEYSDNRKDNRMTTDVPKFTNSSKEGFSQTSYTSSFNELSEQTTTSDNSSSDCSYETSFKKGFGSKKRRSFEKALVDQLKELPLKTKERKETDHEKEAEDRHERTHGKYEQEEQLLDNIKTEREEFSTSSSVCLLPDLIARHHTDDIFDLSYRLWETIEMFHVDSMLRHSLFTVLQVVLHGMFGEQITLTEFGLVALGIHGVHSHLNSMVTCESEMIATTVMTIVQQVPRTISFGLQGVQMALLNIHSGTNEICGDGTTKIVFQIFHDSLFHSPSNEERLQPNVHSMDSRSSRIGAGLQKRFHWSITVAPNNISRSVLQMFDWQKSQLNAMTHSEYQVFRNAFRILSHLMEKTNISMNENSSAGTFSENIADFLFDVLLMIIKRELKVSDEKDSHEISLAKLVIHCLWTLCRTSWDTTYLVSNSVIPTNHIQQGQLLQGQQQGQLLQGQGTPQMVHGKNTKMTKFSMRCFHTCHRHFLETNTDSRTCGNIGSVRRENFWTICLSEIMTAQIVRVSCHALNMYSVGIKNTRSRYQYFDHPRIHSEAIMESVRYHFCGIPM